MGLIPVAVLATVIIPDTGSIYTGGGGIGDGGEVGGGGGTFKTDTLY